MDITYRPINESDINAIKSIYELNIQYLHGVFRSVDEWKTIINENKNHYVVIFKKEIVAWFRIDFEDKQMFLGMLQVSPKYKRKGIGTYIINVFETLAIQKNHPVVYIHTTKDNDAAISFYQKNGYQIFSEEECQTADGVSRIGLTLKKHLS